LAASCPCFPEASWTLLREQPEGIHVAWPKGSEVAAVQGSQLRLVEPFDHGKDGRIHEPHIGVGVTVTELADATVVLGLQPLHPIGAGKDVVEKGQEDSGMKSAVHEPVYFDEHGRGDHQGLQSVPQKIEAAPVLGIGSVEGRIQRPGVED